MSIILQSFVYNYKHKNKLNYYLFLKWIYYLFILYFLYLLSHLIHYLFYVLVLLYVVSFLSFFLFLCYGCYLFTCLFDKDEVAPCKGLKDLSLIAHH